MTGRELIAAVAMNVSNLDKPVLVNDREVLGVAEVVWGPEDMLVAGEDLRGSIILKTEEGEV